jgi:hypothetical protein
MEIHLHWRRTRRIRTKWKDLIVLALLFGRILMWFPAICGRDIIIKWISCSPTEDVHGNESIASRPGRWPVHLPRHPRAHSTSLDSECLMPSPTGEHEQASNATVWPVHRSVPRGVILPSPRTSAHLRAPHITSWMTPTGLLLRRWSPTCSSVETRTSYPVHVGLSLAFRAPVCTRSPTLLSQRWNC